jgi:hypothetical protein
MDEQSLVALILALFFYGIPCLLIMGVGFGAGYLIGKNSKE